MALKISSESDPATRTVKDNFVAKVATVKSKARPLVQRGKDAKARWVKILLYGNTGSGKTFACVGLLKAGLKVIVLSTDLGGSGVASIYNQLEKENRLDLWENLVNIEFPDYDGLSEFLKSPCDVMPDFYDFDPDILMLDGFTGFQQIHIQDKILSDIAPGTKNSSDGRTEGLWAEQQDWGMIRNATVRTLGNFLNMHNWKTGKLLHKIVSCLESKIVDKLTGNTQRGPYIQGSAAALMGPAFDIVIQTKVEGNDESRRYVYNCVGHDSLLAKSRGFPLGATEPADMYKIWTEKIIPTLETKK